MNQTKENKRDSFSISSAWKGDSPIWAAAKFGRTQVVEALLQAPGIEVDKRDPNGVMTPLTVLSALNCPGVVKSLVTAKADVNYQSQGGIQANQQNHLRFSCTVCVPVVILWSFRYAPHVLPIHLSPCSSFFFIVFILSIFFFFFCFCPFNYKKKKVVIPQCIGLVNMVI